MPEKMGSSRGAGAGDEARSPPANGSASRSWGAFGGEKWPKGAGRGGVFGRGGVLGLLAGIGGGGVLRRGGIRGLLEGISGGGGLGGVLRSGSNAAAATDGGGATTFGGGGGGAAGLAGAGFKRKHAL